MLWWGRRYCGEDTKRNESSKWKTIRELFIEILKKKMWWKDYEKKILVLKYWERRKSWQCLEEKEMTWKFNSEKKIWENKLHNQSTKSFMNHSLWRRGKIYSSGNIYLDFVSSNDEQLQACTPQDAAATKQNKKQWGRQHCSYKENNREDCPTHRSVSKGYASWHSSPDTSLFLHCKGN